MAEKQNDMGVVEVGFNSPQETVKQSATRQVVRSAKNVLERAVDAPVNFAEGTVGLINRGIELLPGVQNSPFPDLNLPKPSEYLINPIANALAPAGYLEPQSEAEELADTALKDFVDIFTGGKLLKGAKALKGFKTAAAIGKGLTGLGEAAKEVIPFGNTMAKALKFLRPTEVTAGKAAMMSGLGNLASFGSKKLGYGENVQAGAKVGTMLFAALGGPNAIVNKIKGAYGEMNEVKPPSGSKVPAKTLYDDVQSIQTKLSEGATSETIPEKKIIENFIKDIKNKIDYRDHTISVNSALSLKQDANNILLKLDPSTDKMLRGYVKQASGMLNKSLKGEDAKARYPEFVKALTKADELNAGFENVSEASKFLIGHKILDDVSNPFTRIVFLGNLGEGVKSTFKMFAYQGALRNTVVPLEMFARSPAIRGYYYKAMQAALSNNATVANKYIKKFDKTANELYPGYEEGPGRVE